MDEISVTHVYRNRICIEQRHTKNGKLHHTKEPAWQLYYYDGTKEYEEWRQNGILTRKNGPPICNFDKNGRLIDEEKQNKTNEEKQTCNTEEKNTQDCVEVFETYVNNILVRSRSLKNGKLHSKNTPAIIHNADNGKPYHEEWWFEDKLHRKNGPAVKTFDENYRIISEQWYCNGKLHCENGPALTEYHTVNLPINRRNVISQSWYIDDLLHRDNGPAFTIDDENGNIGERWYCKGKLHRIGGPAVSEYSYANKLCRLMWYVNDMLHNVDGPAISEYYDDGRKKSDEWYIDGKFVKKSPD